MEIIRSVFMLVCTAGTALYGASSFKPECHLRPGAIHLKAGAPVRMDALKIAQGGGAMDLATSPDDDSPDADRFAPPAGATPIYRDGEIIGWVTNKNLKSASSVTDLGHAKLFTLSTKPTRNTSQPAQGARGPARSGTTTSGTQYSSSDRFPVNHQALPTYAESFNDVRNGYGSNMRPGVVNSFSRELSRNSFKNSMEREFNAFRQRRMP
jgi:hypothetical protein